MQLDAAGKREIDHETFGSGSCGYSALMPVPNTKGNPPRIVIQYPAPTVDAGRYPAKRIVGDTVIAE